MNLVLKVWRQKSGASEGSFATYEARDVNPDMSFLEMLDVVNEGLIVRGEEPIAFDSDCREGICGMCSLVINGIAHGGHKGTAACQLHMRHFKEDRKSTRLNSSHTVISYAVFCLKKKKKKNRFRFRHY